MNRTIVVYEDYERFKGLRLYFFILVFGAGVFSGFNSTSIVGSYAYWLSAASGIACLTWLWVVTKDIDRLEEVVE